MFLQFFFFTYTATPQISTYFLTPSQHDALPISSGSDVFRQNQFRGEQPSSIARGIFSKPLRRLRPPRLAAAFGGSAAVDVDLRGRGCDRLLFSVRSEEHTSELQSLMRISSAVFCLKKKYHLSLHYNTPNN